MAPSINPTDILAVTYGTGQQATATITLSGAGSLGDVLRQVRAEAKGCSGLMKIVVRNRTQGWAQRHTIVFKPGPAAGRALSRRPSWGETPSLFDN